ncbi:MAG: OsmC family protein [Firmicutes bacterium]|nr:OsmC family protein [Bacillota bacterium]
MLIQTVAVSRKGQADFEASLPSGKSIVMSSEGPKPVEMIIASLGGCSALTLEEIFKKMRIDVDDMAIEVEGLLTEDKPRLILGARLRCRFWGKDLKEEQVSRAVDLAKEYCSVHHTLEKAGPIEYSYEINPPRQS